MAALVRFAVSVAGSVDVAHARGAVRARGGSMAQSLPVSCMSGQRQRAKGRIMPKPVKRTSLHGKREAKHRP